MRCNSCRDHVDGNTDDCAASGQVEPDSEDLSSDSNGAFPNTREYGCNVSTDLPVPVCIVVYVVSTPASRLLLDQALAKPAVKK